jgi:VanZ family protein
MSAIFVFSAQPARSLPNLGWADLLVKKGGHVLGFGLLALTYWRGLGWNRARVLLAWFLALTYAVTDEAHQAYVAGRHPSAADVLLFDSGGAALALWWAKFRRDLRGP